MHLMLLATVITLSVSAVLDAEDGSSGWTQNWVPSVIRLPEDAQYLTDRAIGLSVRIFSLTTTEDADALLIERDEALRVSGYRIDQSRDDRLDRLIEFSGVGISNAKIVAMASTAGEPTILTFDATSR